MSEIKKGIKLFPRHPLLLGEMGSIYALRGEKEKTRKILNELLERSKEEYVSLVIIARLNAELGEMEQTFECLEKAYETRDFALFTVKAMMFPLLGTDPRLIAFLKKIGLED
ncbi:tetratricopeptide repeat protein [Thermodesulfobacteriota bacterium]